MRVKVVQNASVHIMVDQLDITQITTCARNVIYECSLNVQVLKCFKSVFSWLCEGHGNIPFYHSSVIMGTLL